MPILRFRVRKDIAPFGNEPFGKLDLLLVHALEWYRQ